ncbi:hypothetical protein CVT24_007158 [Panaeolus cyanescens]|uniref:Cytosolic endo-beta-N-acetylglucosaminidase TIM barrel domain-containing protein n=1 Tax=Panaeolus cyanescens TaxID=181874 RepID=A0A409YPI1_9AGAR|nr:hypothetical protein CVT24_007158 [Panaeolus cyanescens]
MPLRGSIEPEPSEPLYFKSLKELDDWWFKRKHDQYDNVLPYRARSIDLNAQGKGKLLSHPYSFSHHRVTIPPPGWISAAHRQGVKMLGTLIFEGGAEEDCLRLVIGKLPTSKTGQVEPGLKLNLPMSPYYSRVLAEIARDRGFDGYLLNFECPLQGGFEQTRSLSAWITLLQSEILDKVGPHGEVSWYDSVIIDGRLAWQDRLNSLNLPFFLSSSTFFSNYTWSPDYPLTTAQYFMSLDSTLTENTPESPSKIAPKNLQDIYMGVDVWGRGSHGGGGFGCYKAISHISPNSLGLSVALFGQAWTWESEQDKPGWNWDKWWEYDSKLWVGPVSGTVDVPEVPPRRPNELPCVHGPFQPLSAFFDRRSPPDPANVFFWTNFCPGSGVLWFSEGSKVFQSDNGWTDVDKQTSVGDLIWPRPVLQWEDEREDTIPEALSAFCFDDAWNGGNSVRFTISCEGSTEDTAAYRSLWLPIHSLDVTLQRIYVAHLIYKVDAGVLDGIDTEIALGVKPIGLVQDGLNCDIVSSDTTELQNGWTKLSIHFSVKSGPTAPSCTSIALGVILAVVTETPEVALQLSFLVGQINVYPHLPESRREDESLILWADYKAKMTTNGASPFEGTLSWDVASTFPNVTPSITSPEDPLSAWNIQPTIPWFPKFIYFNIYAQAYTDGVTVGGVDKAIWVGTSGLGGKKNEFTVISKNLGIPVDGYGKIRFYVQGVTDKGDVLEWKKCAYVDASPYG